MTDETNRLALADEPTDEQIDALVMGAEGPWRITDVEGLGWAMERGSKAEAEKDQVDRLYEAAVKRLDAWRTQRLEAIESGMAYLTAEMTRYATENRKALIKGKSKTIDLPTGQITWRKAGGKLTVTDKDALAAWAVEQGPEAGLFRVKTEPEMRAIQSLFAKTGELPPGTDFEPETESISIKPSRPLLPPETLEIP